MFYPKYYLNNLTEISDEIINENNIKGFILDVDNTLLDFDKKLLSGAREWCDKMKAKNIKLCILSNSNKKEKVKGVANTLQIPYIFFGLKPLKKGFNDAKKILEIEESANIAVVGDQIFTDILGANRVNMIPILVKPLAEKDFFITVVKRPLENYIIKSFQKKIWHFSMKG